MADVPNQKARYALRQPGRRPAFEAGFVPGPIADIRAEAAAKRAAIQSVQEAKAAEAEVQAVERSERVDQSAKVLDQTVQYEADEALYFGMYFTL